MDEKDAETPAGFPERDKVTGELNPYNDVTVILELPEPPCWMARELGDADKEKSGVEMVRVIVLECDSEGEALLPVTVNAYVPAVAVVPTEKVSVEVTEPPEGVTGLALNVAVTPVIAGEMLKVTGELNPLSEVMVIVDIPETPIATLSELGDADMAKSGDCGVDTAL